MKTLKDIEEKRLEGYIGIIFKKDIKKEAIKWIKREIYIQSHLKDKTNYHLIAEARINLFKEFFNITKGDLE